MSGALLRTTPRTRARACVVRRGGCCPVRRTAVTECARPDRDRTSHTPSASPASQGLSHQLRGWPSASPAQRAPSAPRDRRRVAAARWGSINPVWGPVRVAAAMGSEQRGTWVPATLPSVSVRTASTPGPSRTRLPIANPARPARCVRPVLCLESSRDSGTRSSTRTWSFRVCRQQRV